MSSIIGEDESFSLTANITSPGFQRIGLKGYLIKRTSNGTYVASLIPQMFYGVSGEQLTTWRQEFTEAGDQIILSRGAGGYPKVPDEELYWIKVNGRLGQPRTDEERATRHAERFGTEELPPRGTGRLQEPNWGALALIALAILILGK